MDAEEGEEPVKLHLWMQGREKSLLNYTYGRMGGRTILYFSYNRIILIRTTSAQQRNIKCSE